MARSVTKLFRNVIICDDIREEINHKKILIGVYIGDILVQKFPATFSFTMYIEFAPDNAGDILFKFIIKAGKKKILNVEGFAKVEIPGEVAVVPFPKLRANFSNPTELKVYVVLDGGRPVLLASKKVSKALDAD
ncbi:MAG: hypothetical protein ACTSY1_01160 [Alphaproteobacteria bacterium]